MEPLDLESNWTEIDTNATGYLNESFLDVYTLEPGAELEPGAGAPVGPPGAGADIMRLQQHVRTMAIYATPAVLALGVLANLVAAFLLTRFPLRKSPVSVYFLAITVSNEIFLLMGLHEWLTEMGFSLFGVIGGWCQFTTFSRKSSDFLSLWYAVCLTADRYLHIRWTERHAELCTAWRARLVIIGFAILSTVIFLNTSLTVGVFYIPSPVILRPICHTLPMFLGTMRRLSHADVVVNAIIGLGCIIILVGRILYLKARDFKDDLLFLIRNRKSGPRSHSNTLSQTSTLSINGHVQEEYDVTSGQTTAAILYIVLFLLSQLPLQSYRVMDMFKAFTSPAQPSIKSFLVRKILQFIKDVNFASTLFTLMAFHSGFRRTIVSLFSELMHKNMCGGHRANAGIELETDQRSGNSKSSMEESSTVEFVSHESAYV